MAFVSGVLTWPVSRPWARITAALFAIPRTMASTVLRAQSMCVFWSVVFLRLPVEFWLAILRVFICNVRVHYATPACRMSLPQESHARSVM